MQSQPLPLREKPNKQSTTFEDNNKRNIKNNRLSNEYQSPDIEDSNKYSFNVSYVPSSSVTKDTEDVINLDRNNILSGDKKAGNYGMDQHHINYYNYFDVFKMNYRFQ